MVRSARTGALAVAVAALVVGPGLAGCGSGAGDEPTGGARPPAAPEPTTGERPRDPARPDSADTPSAPAVPPSTVPARTGSPAPDWLGTRDLPLRSDGIGEVAPTPPELRDRRLWTESALPPPPGATYEATVDPVPADVLARSTWGPHCPVSPEELRYLTVSFVGFDGWFHTGELIVHADVAPDVVGVFDRLHTARFPIEEMRVVSAADLEAHPTGDGNNTNGFVCRSIVEGGSWSEHAFGLAIDVNPFHNPYWRGETVVPELASAYLDRDDHRPGMIQPGDVVTEAFAEIGWSWGGDWARTLDWMHFSQRGR